MSDMEVAPDPIIRTALQRLPIPTHTDAFWSRLDEALVAAGAPRDPARTADRTLVLASDATAGGAVADAERSLEPDPALALVPPALRRTSNGVLLAVAAAAAAVVMVAGTTLLDDREGTTTAGSDEVAQATASVEALVNEAQIDDGAPAPMSAAGEEASSEAVLAWVEDIGTGDGAGAWEAMGPTSQDHFGSQDAFESEMSSIAEAYGVWSAAEPQDVMVTPVESSEEGTLAVVTLVGMVEDGGDPQRRADAFPVRIVDGDVALEPYAFAGPLEVVVPAEDSEDGVAPPVESGEELVIVVPSNADAPILRLDDGEVVVCGEAEGTELTDLDGAPGQRCSYLPSEGMEPGEHTLTMAFLGSDGASISAGSVLFEAA